MEVRAAKGKFLPGRYLGRELAMHVQLLGNSAQDDHVSFWSFSERSQDALLRGHRAVRRDASSQRFPSSPSPG
eukprot:5934966-Pyramimonas_sp.AAC.1